MTKYCVTVDVIGILRVWGSLECADKFVQSRNRELRRIVLANERFVHVLADAWFRYINVF
jgi:hypothetical protein